LSEGFLQFSMPDKIEQLVALLNLHMRPWFEHTEAEVLPVHKCRAPIEQDEVLETCAGQVLGAHEISESEVEAIAIIVGLLSYIVTKVRHDLKLALSIFATRKHRVSKSYIKNLIKTVSYLHWTKLLGPTLKIQKESRRYLIQIYVDASWVGKTPEQEGDVGKSHIGVVIMVDGLVVRSKSHVRSYKLLFSSNAAEFAACNAGLRMGDDVLQLVEEIALPGMKTDYVVYTDNQQVFEFINGDCPPDLRKITMDVLHIIDAKRRTQMKVKKLAGKDQPADLFTKALPPVQFEKHAKTVLGLTNVDTTVHLADVQPVQASRESRVVKIDLSKEMWKS
jgi:ribonuclease HI